MLTSTLTYLLTPLQALRLAEESWRAARELVGCSGGICEAQGALDVAALALVRA